MYLTVREVAKRLQVSASCVYQLIDMGKLPHFRIGVGRGVIRILEEDLNAYLSASRQAPPAPAFTVRRGKLKSMKF
ncbi:MAG: helix-turn-helix domain-containing protein [Planctomycetaceae bacterium]|nr:helix-turn-helix domain-containing protein [Planctomycetaceae bacterium]